jgi:cytosine permease
MSKQSTMALSATLAGVPFCVSGLLVGGALVKELSLAEGLLAAALGCAVLTGYAGWIGMLGAKTGSSTSQLLTSAFGTLGSRVVSCVIALCLVGWYGVQAEFFGKTIHTMFPGWILTETKIASTWGGGLMLLTAFFGIRGLAALSLVACPLIVGLTMLTLSKVGWAPELWAAKPVEPGAFSDAITMVIGSFAIGATVNADITRYAKNAKSAWIATFVGFFIASLYIFACGAISTTAGAGADLIAAMANMGMGMFAFLTLVLSQWTTNDNNMFYAAASMESVLPKAKREHIVLAFGVVATALAVAGVTDRFVDFLVLLGILIPPVGGIMLAHHGFAGRQATESTSPFPFPALAAWVVGILVGKYVAFGVAAVNAVIAASVTYYFWRRAFQKTLH